MNKKKIIKIIVAIVSFLLIIALAFLGFKTINASKSKKANELQDMKISQEEPLEEKNLNVIIEKLPSSLIYFNAKTKEISYQKNGEISDSYYVNGDKLGATKEYNGNIMQGLVPHKIEERLFFVDLDFNTLVEVSVFDEELDIEVVLNDANIDLRNIKEMSVVNDIMYLILNEGDILEIELDMTNKMVKKYKTELNPSMLFKLNGEFYFMDKAYLVKNVEQGGKLIETKRLELGAMLSDFRVDEGYLYALSMFGRKENNSVLMKIDLADLVVKDIMPLRGIGSVFIGLEDEIAYIGQQNSIKEVNIETFTPLRAFQREQDETVQYLDFKLYKLLGQELETISLEDMKVMESTKISFDNFHVVRQKVYKVTTKKIANTEIEEVSDISKDIDSVDMTEVVEEDKINDTPEKKLLREKIRTKVKEEYALKNGKELSDEELDKLTNQIMENKSMLELFYASTFEEDTSSDD